MISWHRKPKVGGEHWGKSVGCRFSIDVTKGRKKIKKTFKVVVTHVRVQKKNKRNKKKKR